MKKKVVLRPIDPTKIERRRICIVLLLRQVKSKNGGASSCILFFSLSLFFILRFWLFKCKIALR